MGPYDDGEAALAVQAVHGHLGQAGDQGRLPVPLALVENRQLALLAASVVSAWTLGNDPFRIVCRRSYQCLEQFQVALISEGQTLGVPVHPQDKWSS